VSDTVRALREGTPLLHRGAYLNYAAVAPRLAPVARALAEWDETRGRLSGPAAWERLGDAERRFREGFARLLGANADDVVGVANTAVGVNTLARSLPIEPGDLILLADCEYPANAYPWLQLAARGVRVETVPVGDGTLAAEQVRERAAGRRLAVVAVSSVQYLSGAKADLVALAAATHEAGGLLVVDAIQSLGAFPLPVDESGVDAVTAGTNKWLLGAMGYGGLWIRPELQARLRDGAYVGALSVRDPMDFRTLDPTPREGVRRFELGTPSEHAIVAGAAALDVIFELGPDRVARRVAALAAELHGACRAMGLEPLSPPDSGIVVIRVPDAELAARELAQREVWTTIRYGTVRLAVHGLTTDAELESGIAALRSLLD
jgi:selenocysteine lyase/cysteine desulfurase